MSKEYRKIEWEVVPVNTPLIIRHCQRCKKKSKFFCSGQFRVNANKDKIDVWLIYKCESCESTWNMTVLSRVSIKQMDKEMYEKFLKNDEQAAQDCSFNLELIRKNEVKVDYSSVEYTVLGEDIKVTDGFSCSYEITIKTRYKFNLRLDRLLKDKMCISRNDVYRLADTSCVTFCPDVNIRKYKIKEDIRMFIRKYTT